MSFAALTRRYTVRAFCQGVLATLLFGFSQPAGAQEMQIESAVQVAVQEDVAKTRSQALSDAMERALEMAIDQAAPEVRGRLYLVSARAREFVSSYRVVEETEQAGRLSLKIAAQVDVAHLLRELQAVLPKSKRSDGRPKILICTRLAGAEPSAATLAAEARDLLVQRGQPVELGSAERCQPSNLSSWPGPRLIFDGTVAAKGAEVRGTSPRLYSSLVHGGWQYFADTTAQPQMESGDGTGFAERSEEALAQATAQLGRPLLSRLAERNGLLGRVGGGVLLIATGLRSPQVMNKLWKALLALPGVSRVEPRRFLVADGADEQVHFQLTTTTAPETLGTALYRTPIAGLRVQVVPLGPSTLRLDCVPAQELPSATPDAQPLPTEAVTP